MSRTAALEIAAPSAAVDPLAPWIGARTSSERALAATFLVSIGGLSGLLHTAAVVFALIASLLPLPFLPAACAPVKRFEATPPERVLMSIVEVEPPPEVVEPPPPPVEEEAPSPKLSKVKKAQLEREVAVIGMLALLRSAEPTSDVFGTLDSGIEGNVLGGLMGAEIGDSFGAGGLGLSGVGVAGGSADLAIGGGGGTAIGIGGLGSIGTIGKGGGGTGQGYGMGQGGFGGSSSLRVDVIDTDLATDVVRRALLLKKSAVLACPDSLPADVTVRVTDGKVTSVEGATACLARALTGAAVGGTGYAAVHLEHR